MQGTEQLTTNKPEEEKYSPKIFAFHGLLKHVYLSQSCCLIAALVYSKSIKGLNVSEVM